jgi:hypothetical protein
MDLQMHSLQQQLDKRNAEVASLLDERSQGQALSEAVLLEKNRLLVESTDVQQDASHLRKEYGKLEQRLSACNLHCRNLQERVRPPFHSLARQSHSQLGSRFFLVCRRHGCAPGSVAMPLLRSRKRSHDTHISNNQSLDCQSLDNLLGVKKSPAGRTR